MHIFEEVYQMQAKKVKFKTEIRIPLLRNKGSNHSIMKAYLNVLTVGNVEECPEDASWMNSGWLLKKQWSKPYLYAVTYIVCTYIHTHIYTHLNTYIDKRFVESINTIKKGLTPTGWSFYFKILLFQTKFYYIEKTNFEVNALRNTKAYEKFPVEYLSANSN